jgi:DNA mismatch repair protein MutS
MSKLLNQYNELKKKDSTKIYIFQVGIFYNILQEDAKVVSNAIGLKLTNLSPEIIKCGFPIAKLDKYTTLLKEKNLQYEVISTSATSNQNTSYQNIINKIKNIDLNNTTFKEAFDILYNIQQKLKNIQ